MSKYTYSHQYAAHYGDRVVTVPDQVAAAQSEYDGRSFPAKNPACYPWHGSTVRVRLDGAAYGLDTPGTGDMIVRAA